MIDLHMHSTFSDGSLTPTELIALARAAGLTAVALTDHDSTAGTPEFLAACAAQGQPPLEGIAGVEISADAPRGTLHMLGYFLDTDNAELQAALLRIRNGRETRNFDILARLQKLGLELTWEEVASRAVEDVVGRPHFADALQARGYVKDRQDAFDRYLGKGRPGYADRFRFSAEQSIAAIRGAGGVAVLAHPFTLELGPADLRAAVAVLRDEGLGGIEVHYSEHTDRQTAQYAALAREFGLAAAGGSDFHGAGNPQIRIGRGFGRLNVPDDLIGPLRRAAGRG